MQARTFGGRCTLIPFLNILEKFDVFLEGGMEILMNVTTPFRRKLTTRFGGN